MTSSQVITKQRASGAAPSRTGLAPKRTRALALPFTCGAALAVLGLPLWRRPPLFWTFVGAGGLLLVWSAVLAWTTRRIGRALELEVLIRQQHWVQACAQGLILLYWGWHVRFVYAFLPFIIAQLIFAYGVDSLITWSRRDRYTLGFGPFPVILSINLFLWFRPEWFYWQFAMIIVGYLAKEFIRWNRDGRSAHIFNPSSFPLAVFSLGLILTGSSDITLGSAIASSQFYPPHIYLVIFLAALPGQLLFGVARMTMPAVVTMVLISAAYFAATGTYLFYDSAIPIAIFLGMHLLFTDPSTSPRTESGRIVFGVLYALGTTAFYVLLGAFDIPTFYDKLLPVPLMNLMVRRIDLIARSDRLAALDLGRFRGLATRRPDLAYVSIWALAFVGLSMSRTLGDNHPGQALPFWRNTCEAGNERACAYADAMTRIYCDNGSGWACNEWGIQLHSAGQSAQQVFAQGCRLGFAPACENANRVDGDVDSLVRGSPTAADWPIVLRGTKPPLRNRSADELRQLACAQGWPGACDR